MLLTTKTRNSIKLKRSLSKAQERPTTQTIWVTGVPKFCNNLLLPHGGQWMIICINKKMNKTELQLAQNPD